jgi:Glycogen debranching enzyme N terminal
MMHANDAVNRNAEFINNTFITKLYNDTPGIYINVPGGDYHHHPDWFLHFNYAVEQYRGLDFDEDLFNPGHFSVTLKEGDQIGIILSADNPAGRNALELLKEEKARREKLLEGQADDETIRQLILAADQFIVKRAAPSNSPQGGESNTQPLPKENFTNKSTTPKSRDSAMVAFPFGEGRDGALASVIAGYHWFTDDKFAGIVFEYRQV